MGWFIAWLWQGVLLVGVVGLALRVVRRVSAATCYAVWWSTLAVVGSLPWLVDAVGDLGTAPGAATRPTVPLSPALVELPSLPVELLLGAVGCWLLLSGARLASMVAGIRRLVALKGRCAPLPAGIETGLSRWMRVRDRGRPARLATSSEVAVASVLGLTRPVIVLPAMLLDTLDADELDQVVLHEYAHVQRRDDWARLLQVGLEAVLCFHPAVWWIGRALHLEREVACDDWVVARWGRRRYAQCLTTVARAACARGAALAPGISSTPTVLARRLARVLDHRRNLCARVSSRVVLSGVVSVLAVTLAVDHWSPRIAFEPDTGRMPTVEGQPLERLHALARTPLAPRAEGLEVTIVPRPAAPPPAPVAPAARLVTTASVRDWQRAITRVPAIVIRPEDRRARPPIEASPIAFAPTMVAPVAAPTAGAIGERSRARVIALERMAGREELSPGHADALADASSVTLDVWTVTAEAGMVIGAKTKEAGLATAGFFTKMGKSIARAF